MTSRFATSTAGPFEHQACPGAAWHQLAAERAQAISRPHGPKRAQPPRRPGAEAPARVWRALPFIGCCPHPRGQEERTPTAALPTAQQQESVLNVVRTGTLPRLLLPWQASAAAFLLAYPPRRAPVGHAVVRRRCCRRRNARRGSPQGSGKHPPLLATARHERSRKGSSVIGVASMARPQGAASVGHVHRSVPFGAKSTDQVHRGSAFTELAAFRHGRTFFARDMTACATSRGHVRTCD